jgi:hypothetical protein
MADSVGPLQAEDNDQAVRGSTLTDHSSLKKKKGRGGEWEKGRNSPFEGGRALKICPVGKFSEGASLQGRGDVLAPQIPPSKGVRGMS